MNELLWRCLHVADKQLLILQLLFAQALHQFDQLDVHAIVFTDAVPVEQFLPHQAVVLLIRCEIVRNAICETTNECLIWLMIDGLCHSNERTDVLCEQLDELSIQIVDVAFVDPDSFGLDAGGFDDCGDFDLRDCCFAREVLESGT